MMRNLTPEHRAKIKAGMAAAKAQGTKLGPPRRYDEKQCVRCGGETSRGRSGLCRTCYYANVPRGEKHHQWSKTGRASKPYVRGGSNQSYTFVRVAPGKWRPEHCILAERVLGRRLKKGEVVHHINGDGLDNRNENLLICTQTYHAWLHTRMADAWMREHFKRR